MGYPSDLTDAQWQVIGPHLPAEVPGRRGRPRIWPIRRIVEAKHRRTIRDYERLPASHEAMILRAMIALMTHRLAQPGQLSNTH